MKTMQEKRETALRNLSYGGIRTLPKLQAKFELETKLCVALGKPLPTMEKFKRLQRELPR